MDKATEDISFSVPRRRRGCLWGCLSLAILWAAAAILLPKLTNNYGPTRIASCANDLRQIGLSLRMYSKEDPDSLYPPISSLPGRLMFDAAAMYPTYAPDPYVLVCPADGERPAHVQGSKYSLDNLDEFFDDKSYVYLGYAIRDEEDLERFVAAYRAYGPARLAAFGDLTTGRGLPAGPAFNSETIYRLRLELSDSLVPSDVSEEFREWPKERRDERMSIASQKIAGGIPVMIERPDNHPRPLGNVLYLDGHVEKINFPGKWPMTQRTMDLLNELDQLAPIPDVPR